MKPSLWEFTKKALHNPGFNELIDCSVYVSPSIRKQINTILGVDVSKYFIHSVMLRAIYQTNGRTTEYTKSDRSLTDSDMERIQQVLEHPDIVNDASYDVESGMGVRICRMVGEAAYWVIMEVDTEHDAPIAVLANFVFDRKPGKETEFAPRRNEELGDVDPFNVASIINDGLLDLYDIAVEYASKDRKCRIALDWCSSLSRQLTPDAFMAACMVQKAGFDLFEDLPKIKEVKTNYNGYMSIFYDDIPSHGVYPSFRNPICLRAWEPGDIRGENKYYNLDLRFFSSVNTTVHELCHVIRFGSMGLSNYNEYCEEEKNVSRNITHQISGYANHNGAEFHAEVLSGILSGRSFSKEVIDAIRPYTNPDRRYEKAYNALVRQGLDNKPGAYVPQIMKKTMGRKCSTDIADFADLLDARNASADFRKTRIFKYHDAVADMMPDYGTSYIKRYIIDLYCKVACKSLDCIYNSALHYVEPHFRYSNDQKIGTGSGLLGKITKTDWLVDSAFYNYIQYSLDNQRYTIKDKKEFSIMTNNLSFYREWVHTINALKQGDTTVQSTLKRFAASAEELRQQKEKIQKNKKK